MKNRLLNFLRCVLPASWQNKYQESILHKKFHKLIDVVSNFQELYDKIGILYIKPDNHYSPEPIIDEITKKMTCLWRKKEDSKMSFFGFHTCSCGARSTAMDYLLPAPKESNYLLTNSLCLHYLAFHRDQIPIKEMNKVHEIILEADEEIPTREELVYPTKNLDS